MDRAYLSVSFVIYWLFVKNSLSKRRINWLWLLSFLLELESARLDLSMLAETKIRKFDVTLRVQQNIIGLQISVNIVQFVHRLNSENL